MYRLWNASRSKIVTKIFIIITLAYSAGKNTVNGLAAYSTLKPDVRSRFSFCQVRGVSISFC